MPSSRPLTRAKTQRDALAAYLGRGSKEPVTGFCGAKLAQRHLPPNTPWRYCRQRPMPNGRCRFHGGPSLSGAAHPNFQTGKASIDLPRGLADRVERKLANPELLSLRRDIARLDVKQNDLEHEIAASAEGHEAAWTRAVEARDRLDDARARGDEAGQRTALGDLLTALRGPGNPYKAFAQLVDVMERKRRLVETEIRRLSAAQDALSAEEATALLLAILDIMFRYVKTDGDRRAAMTDVQRLRVLRAGPRVEI